MSKKNSKTIIEVAKKYATKFKIDDLLEIGGDLLSACKNSSKASQKVPVVVNVFSAKAEPDFADLPPV